MGKHYDYLQYIFGYSKVHRFWMAKYFIEHNWNYSVLVTWLHWIILEFVLDSESWSQLLSGEDDGLAVALEVATDGPLPFNLHVLAGFQFGEDIEGDGSPARLVYGRGILGRETYGLCSNSSC